MNMKLPPLSERLREALKYIKPGDRVADIGTDHAYLPIYLVKSGISPASYASDINEGPCERARENVKKYGIGEDKIIVERRDGISGMGSLPVDCFVICGMGGELIANILAGEKVPTGTGFVLNPMTKQESLRAYLTENGYEITGESLVLSDGKIYQMISCTLTGEAQENLSRMEMRFGRHILAERSALCIEYLEKTLRELKYAQKGRASAGVTSEDDLLITDIEKYLQN